MTGVPTVPLYTFYLTRPDGLSNTFETFELQDQREADACATRMLDQHLSAASVVAYRDQTQVITRRRPEPCGGPETAVPLSNDKLRNSR